ncbi:hypothetical protein SESBI_32451 [Sesbania bispinosa]|nr:hypothetical protein SESBI_32439 [Sesbania bispinosa]KAJ1396527.1 hypothetical protein SESBI_32451 [Sesbania bispinosa]
MASGKCFITALLLALTFSSMSFSLAARHLLQTAPTLPGIPTLPKPTLPPLPSIPTLPQGNVPPLPTIPTLPQPTLPPLPSMSIPTIPTLPQVNLPPLPATSLPNFPQIPTTMPSIPFLSPPPSTSSTP